MVKEEPAGRSTTTKVSECLSLLAGVSRRLHCSLLVISWCVRMEDKGDVAIRDHCVRLVLFREAQQQPAGSRRPCLEPASEEVR